MNNAITQYQDESKRFVKLN